MPADSGRREAARRRIEAERAAEAAAARRRRSLVGGVVAAVVVLLAVVVVVFAEQPAGGGPGLDYDRLIALAADAGAQGSAVERAIRERTFGDWTRSVTDAASRDGVTGTPTVVVDGEPLPADQLTAAGITAAVRSAAG